MHVYVHGTRSTADPFGSLPVTGYDPFANLPVTGFGASSASAASVKASTPAVHKPAKAGLGEFCICAACRPCISDASAECHVCMRWRLPLLDVGLSYRVNSFLISTCSLSWFFSGTLPRFLGVTLYVHRLIAPPQVSLETMHLLRVRG